jgi:FtsH-binding integral membrane protein
MIGVMLSPLPLIYAVGTLGGTFVATSAMFAGLAAFGYLTKRDLSGVGRFLMMAMWGLFAAWLVSIFIPGVYFWVSAIGIVIFAGLTAWDTQRIKQFYLESGARGNLAIVGALMLYTDFINMFLFLLRLFGGSRD